MTRGFLVDAIPPKALVVLTPAAGETVPSRSVTLAGTAEPAAHVDVRGLPPASLHALTAALDSSWSATVTLMSGAYTTRLRAIDAVGNASPETT